MGVLCKPGKHVLTEVRLPIQYIYTYFCANCPVEFDMTMAEMEAWRGPIDHLLRIHLLAAEVAVAAEGS